MSTVTLAEVKADLRVVHSDDDALLQVLIDAAEDEAVRFMNLDALPTQGEAPDPVVVAPSIYAGVFLLVRAKYDAERPEDIVKLRAAAEILLAPYRVGLGA